MKQFIINIDDVALTHGSNMAYFNLALQNKVSSGSVMCVCPYYSEFLCMYREHNNLPIGLHVTLTSEWSTYKWRPLIGIKNSLCDNAGYFHRNKHDFFHYAKTSDIELEMRMQIERVLADGVKLTHIDSHMGTAFLPNAIDSFLKLSQEYKITPVLSKNNKTFEEKFYPPEANISIYNDTLSEYGVKVLFDDFVIIEPYLEKGWKGAIEDLYFDCYASYSKGVYFVSTHADMGSELWHFAPHWLNLRTTEASMLASKRFADRLEEMDIRIITWDELILQAS